MNEKSKGTNSWAFLAGLLTGAAVVFLLATDEGRKISTRIKKRVDNFLESLETELSQAEPEVGENQREEGENKKIDLVQAAKNNLDYIKDLQNRGRIFGRRFFKRH